MRIVVMDHHYDEGAEPPHYSITIGWVADETVTTEKPVSAPGEPLEVEPVEETRSTLVHTEDFLFADDDRWDGLPEAGVIERQRQLVAEVLMARQAVEAEAEAAAATARRDLGGAGTAL